MDSLKDALQYVADMARKNEKTEVLEICGHTYGNKELRRYDVERKAEPLNARTLSSLVEYIADCGDEFKGRKMIVHVVGPGEVRLLSGLDADRERETLFVTKAECSGFMYDHWYDQERFMIELQAGFQANEDLQMVMKAAGNIERKNNQTFSDDGVTQVATMTVGVAAKKDVIVPNPVELVPYRTFQEISQPASRFVFRIGDGDAPCFKIVEAEGGIWKHEAIRSIKEYLVKELYAKLDEDRLSRLVIIG